MTLQMQYCIHTWMHMHVGKDTRLVIHYQAIAACLPSHSTLQHTATHCNTLQHTATHCSTLQHTALSQPALSRLHYRVLECQWMTKRRIAWATWRWDNVWRCMSGTANAWMHMHVFTQGRIRLWILQMVCCPSLMTQSTSIVQCHSQHVTLIAHPVCCHP